MWRTAEYLTPEKGSLKWTIRGMSWYCVCFGELRLLEKGFHTLLL
jgi:hypothetical protein